jgi:hypothetical protein
MLEPKKVKSAGQVVYRKEKRVLEKWVGLIWTELFG